MPKLKLTEILDDKPVKVTVELPAKLHRDLVAYAQVLGGEAGSSIPDPARLIARCSNASWRRIEDLRSRGGPRRGRRSTSLRARVFRAAQNPSEAEQSPGSWIIVLWRRDGKEG